MALLKIAANTDNNNEMLDDRSVIPAGNYLVHIVKSEMKATKAKTGFYLSLHFKVLEGQHEGRMVFTNLNLDNPNPVATEIARKELNSICEAVNMQGVEDSEEIHQLPLVVKVTVKAATAQWPEGNEIKGYASADDYEGEADVAEEATSEAEGSKPWE